MDNLPYYKFKWLNQKEVGHDMLSKYCSNITNKYNIKVGGINKLIPNLGKKSKYVLHYKNLQLCLSLRMELAKVEIQTIWLVEKIY